MEYKRKIVREADECKSPGAVKALLRREGLYSSHLTMCRAARERGELAGAAKKRGPTPLVTDAPDKVIAEQARELARWKHPAEHRLEESGAQSATCAAALMCAHRFSSSKGRLRSRRPMS